MTLAPRERLELIAGPDPLRPVFRSDAVRRDAYFDHQDDLHEGLPAGRRPWAFWAYVLGELPDVDDEPRRLAERDLLHPEEELEILALAACDPILAPAAAIIRARSGAADPG